MSWGKKEGGRGRGRGGGGRKSEREGGRGDGEVTFIIKEHYMESKASLISKTLSTNTPVHV